MNRPDEAVPELAAQRTNVAVDGPRPAAVAIAPHAAEELGTGEDGAVGDGQRIQEVELGGCEVDWFAAAFDSAGRFIQNNGSQAETTSLWSGIVGSSQHGMDTSHEKARAEWLCDLVVGTDPQADQHVGLVTFGSEHRHRCAFVLLDPTTHFDAVKPGQHEI